jgi:hypothetical protein
MKRRAPRSQGDAPTGTLYQRTGNGVAQPGPALPPRRGEEGVKGVGGVGGGQASTVIGHDHDRDLGCLHVVLILEAYASLAGAVAPLAALSAIMIATCGGDWAGE